MDECFCERSIGLDHLVYILGYHYNNVADEEGLPAGVLLGQDRLYHQILQEACDKAGFSLLTCHLEADVEESGAGCRKEDIVCSIKHVADVRGNIAFRGLDISANDLV
jgi:hypothetical protein